MYKNIYNFSRPAGSGKTFIARKLIQNQEQLNQKTIISQPTTQLLDQTEKDAIADQQFTPTIYHTNNNKRVLSDLTTHMTKSKPFVAETLGITHETLKNLPYGEIPYPQYWDLIIDEPLDVFFHTSINISQTHKSITPYLIAKPFFGRFLQLEQIECVELQTFAENKTADDAWGVVSPLLRKIIDPKYLVLVDQVQYKNLIDQKSTKKMDFFCILTPKVIENFKSVVVMAALFEHTLMYKIWSKILKVKFIEHKKLATLLPAVEHTNGNRLTIYYALETDWSKKSAMINKISENAAKDTVIQRISNVVEDFFEERKFIWMCNVDDNFETFDSLRSKLPNKSHGLNRYRKYHNVVLTSALNLTGPAYKFLEELGISNEETRAAIYYYTLYQAMMRCSLRDPAATDSVVVIVMDKNAAEWLGNIFPGCQVKQLPGKMPVINKNPNGRPRKYADRSAEGKAYRARQKEKENANVQN